MLRSGVTEHQVRRILQRTPGTLSHAVLQWKALQQVGRQFAMSAHSRRLADDISSSAGWLHLDELTVTHVDFICGRGTASGFVQNRRLQVLRLVARNAGRTASLAFSLPVARETLQRTAQPLPCWTADDLRAFCLMFPVGTVEHTAANLMIWLGLSPAALVYLDADELDALSDPRSRFGVEVHFAFAALPSGLYGAVEDMRRSGGGLAARMRAATARAGVPNLTRQSVVKLNAELVGAMIARPASSGRYGVLVDGLM
ncbi:hypothetical protein D1012_20655 [Pseudotabrizicola alkalilacus]|uniref:Uncharacterized protein n=2 Tax=Pseudotabrizicola alkalilacus TaxID=2305252 RepID=A0A411YWU7_9RHOB|nr:hypothetical protein D1012_20655 [Pseudotabrizicola alkalilacus]